MAEFAAATPWIEHLHVFHWRVHERLPLADGVDRWQRYVAAAEALGRSLAAALELVQNDDPTQLIADSATLIELLANRQPPIANRHP